jgi:hypothetical protein
MVVASRCLCTGLSGGWADAFLHVVVLDCARGVVDDVVGLRELVGLEADAAQNHAAVMCVFDPYRDTVRGEDRRPGGVAAEEAEERLWVADVRAQLDEAVQVAGLEEPGRVGLNEGAGGKPRSDGRGVESEGVDGRRGGVHVGRERAPAMQRVDPDSPAAEELPFGEMHMPDPEAGPADLLARPYMLAVTDDRRDVPVGEVADLCPPVETRPRDVVSRRGDRAGLDRVDAVRQKLGCARLGVGVVDADVDAEVIAGQTGVVLAPRVEERSRTGCWLWTGAIGQPL